LIAEHASGGAVVVDNRGIIESAGTYIDAPTGKAKLGAGLGTRHAAAAAVTTETDAIAVVVSASSGAITVFHEGKPIIELENPHARTEGKSGRGKPT
jgi:DNA integrity scanning protein DisA with diadenylate cyclase activity